jgi:membrane-associated protease RseP (regulator of RpoE activity)
MRRFVFAMVMVTVGLSWGLTCVRAGAAQVVPVPRFPSWFGARVRPVPPLLYEHVPQLKRGQGLAVDHVQANSVAETAGLRLHDILLSYDDTELNSVEQFDRLLRAGKVDSPVTLMLLRGGKETKLEMVLPVPQGPQNSTASIKRGGPPAINLTAQPMRDGKLKVTFEYYADEDSGKLRQLTCSGSLQQIEQRVEELPMRLQDLARVALQRLRSINPP